MFGIDTATSPDETFTGRWAWERAPADTGAYGPERVPTKREGQISLEV